MKILYGLSDNNIDVTEICYDEFILSASLV